MCFVMHLVFFAAFFLKTVLAIMKESLESSLGGYAQKKKAQNQNQKSEISKGYKMNDLHDRTF